MSALDHYAVNRLMQELFSEPENLASFTADRAALYDKYGLSADQRPALDGCGQAALTSAGLHPALQMHNFMAKHPIAFGYVSVQAYRALVAYIADGCGRIFDTDSTFWSPHRPTNTSCSN